MNRPAAKEKRRSSERSRGYLKTRIRGQRLYEAAFILAFIELSRRLHQAYEQAYDKEAAEWLLPQNPDKEIAAAVDRARTILSTQNPCSAYFGPNAIKALNTFEGILARGYPPAGPGDKKLGIIQSGQQTTHNNPTDYRTYQSAVINKDGPFFNRFSNTRIGGYDPGRNQSQVLQILHELAHLVYSGGAPLIPDDAGTTKKVDSDVNTREVLKHCKSEIDKIKN